MTSRGQLTIVEKNDRLTSNTARILGAGSAGFVEIVLFHPMDTVSKRLMSHQAPIYVSGQSLTIARANLREVIFREFSHSSPFRQLLGLFPGFKFGVMFKISQRIHRFGGQLWVRDQLSKRYLNTYQRFCGEKYARPMLEATSGSIIGATEIILLPFDVLKIKSQTNPASINGRSLFRILREEGVSKLYRGSLITAARNAPGSFALFGGASVVRERVFGVSHIRDATLFQHLMAAIAGSIASIVTASPFDVIKTRLQRQNFDQNLTGRQIVKEIHRTEGYGAYFKGLTPKFISVGPKLVFSFTLSHYLIVKIDTILRGTRKVESEETTRFIDRKR